MKIKFCGAAREVTGSCHLITLEDGFKILLDCGLYQGGDDDGRSEEDSKEPEHTLANFNEKWLFNPREVDVLILSHAHIDHSGRIPKLVANGFSGKIYATHATRDLCSIMLLDSAKIQESDAEYHNKKHRNFNEPEKDPLYTSSDVYNAIGRFSSFNYEQHFFPHPHVEVEFRDAGHILGSASVHLRIRENDQDIRLAFTGDIGRPNRPILMDPKPMQPADYIICESTYGDREHVSAPNELESFLQIVLHTCIEKKGKLIIPAFSVGRTQEVVYILSQLHYAGKLPKIPIYVDSPLAVNATQVFISHPECMDEEIHRYLIEAEDPWGFNGLTYVRSTEGSKALNSIEKPCIIISASGMMNAGRIVHHVHNNIEDQRNTFLLVGYCSPHTLGGALRAGAKSVHVFGDNLQVLADVAIMDSFSAHGDRVEMYDFLANQKDTAQKIFLVHGTIDRQESWRDYLLEKGFKSVEIPSLGQEFELS
ncbi:MAG: MBL fold metallo-hydrolase [Bacteroidetes bacterium]|nr:MBL fold metallo-hydrolase [Bacteroidota bacterium]